jgi:protein SCO1/2
MKFRGAAVILLATGLLCGQSTVVDQRAEDAAARRYFTDTVLVDQNGAERRFYTDLVQGNVVIIDVMFTSCKDSCPRMAGNLSSIAQWLGPRLGNRVRILSISIDPETDTPARLKEYAERFHGGPGWYFLSGKKDNVELVLKKLGLYVPEKQDHLNLFLIGNDRTGLWKKAFGMADSKQLIGTIESVLNDPM